MVKNLLDFIENVCSKGEIHVDRSQNCVGFGVLSHVILCITKLLP